MIRTIDGSLYDYPKYYDLVFGTDWKAEFDFLRVCFERYARRPVHRVFEPACGTGRLMIKLATAGYEVAGNDLNASAARYCNARLERGGFPPTAVVGDMANFRLDRRVDAAHCMINSFRHLPDEAAAIAHFQCVAAALAKGGLYVMGLHLTPTTGDPSEEESWSARRGNLAILSRLWTIGVDLRRRAETVGMTFDVYTPTDSFRLRDQFVFRTYTARQMQSLLARVPELEIAATYDFAYEIEHPIAIRPHTQDVVYVLRKR